MYFLFLYVDQIPINTSQISFLKYHFLNTTLYHHPFEFLKVLSHLGILVCLFVSVFTHLGR